MEFAGNRMPQMDAWTPSADADAWVAVQLNYYTVGNTRPWSPGRWRARRRTQAGLRIVILPIRYSCPQCRSFSRVTPPSSARLTFRSWTDKDTALAEALWCDPEVTHYFGGPMSREQAHARLDIERARENSLGMQYWPIFFRDTGAFAGCAGLRPWQMDPNTIEAGVHLMRSAWGQRLGEESLRAVLAYGFDTLRLTTIVAGHGFGHDNSQKLLERVGFAHTHHITWGPKAIDVRMYAIDANLWRIAGASESA
jgi:ribosomal-protein-alanine N-acetyltransferase